MKSTKTTKSTKSAKYPKNRKRRLCPVLALIAALSMLLACSSQPGQTSGGESTQGSQSGQQGSSSSVTEETVHISYMCTLDLALQDSYVTQKLPELLKKYGYNVELEMRSLGTHDPAEWDQKFQLAVTSGEAPPDIIQLGALNTIALNAGWFAPISEDLVKESMPKYYEQVQKIYEPMWAWGKDPKDGTLYGIPSFNMYGPTRHTLAYRGDWLEQFDMEPPTTIEEFEVWLQKCRTEDPNGNGQADEYGYTSQDADGYLAEVFGAYGIMPGQWMLRDDKIVCGSIQPEAKDALLLLKKWYDNDWIPKGIMTTAKRDNDFYAGIVGTMGQAGGYAPAIVPSGSYTAALQAQNPGAYIVGAPSFKGPEGHYGTYEWGPKKYVLTFGSHLDEEKIRYIMGMFETIASEKELFELTMLGEWGVHWDFADPEAESGATVFLEPYTDFTKKLNEVGVRELSESAWCPVWIEEVYTNYMDPLAIEYANQNEGNDHGNSFLAEHGDPLYKENLNNYVKEFYLGVITGKNSIDEFDSFVEKWYSDGGEILTQEANQLYDTMFR